MKWISVKERLPEHFSSVLVFGQSIRTCALYEDGIFYCDFRLPKHEDITHWMPLPEPPTE